MNHHWMTRDYEPTHLLDGRDTVGKIRPASHLLYMRNSLGPQVDRARASRHGLYLAHHAEDIPDGWFGDLLVTGDRLTPINH